MICHEKNFVTAVGFGPVGRRFSFLGGLLVQIQNVGLPVFAEHAERGGLFIGQAQGPRIDKTRAAYLPHVQLVGMAEHDNVDLSDDTGALLAEERAKRLLTCSLKGEALPALRRCGVESNPALPELDVEAEGHLAEIFPGLLTQAVELVFLEAVVVIPYLHDHKEGIPESQPRNRPLNDSARRSPTKDSAGRGAVGRDTGFRRPEVSCRKESKDYRKDLAIFTRTMPPRAGSDNESGLIH